jgi:hypothetical protein
MISNEVFQEFLQPVVAESSRRAWNRFTKGKLRGNFRIGPPNRIGNCRLDR